MKLKTISILALVALAVGLIAVASGCGSAATTSPGSCPPGAVSNPGGCVYTGQTGAQQGATSASNITSATAAAAPVLTTDPYGQQCQSLDASGYCPGDDPTTDPNGQQCQSLDASGYCPGDDPSPTPTMTKQTDIVVFSVSGSGEPTVQYGTDSSTNNPTEGAGPLGDGVYLPWHASMSYDSAALYYAVTAQLQGSGSIQDSVTEVITTWCSGSKPKTETFPLANGSASGGYGIATAEYTGGDTGNAAQAESDAGC